MEKKKDKKHENKEKKEVDEALRKELAEEQEKINKLYEKFGLTDEVLELQIQLNKRRHELDISDETKLNKDGWSQ